MKEQFTLFRNTEQSLALLGNMVLLWLSAIKKILVRLSGILSLVGNRILSLVTSIKKWLGNTILLWITTMKKLFTLFRNTLRSWLVAMKKYLTKLMGRFLLFGKSSLAWAKRSLILFGNTLLAVSVATKKVLISLSSILTIFWKSWSTNTKKAFIKLAGIFSILGDTLRSWLVAAKGHVIKLAGVPALLGNTMRSGFVNLNNRLSLVGSKIKSSRPQFTTIKKIPSLFGNRTEIPSIFLVVVTVLAVVISISGLFTNVGLPGRIFQILFLPITIYLVTCSAKLIISGSSAFGTRGGWSKVLRYYCLLVSLAIVVAGLMSARTPSEFIVSIVFSALAVYFLISVWPGIGFEFHLSPISKTAKATEKVDVNRRDFLKLVGTAGISMFLYNLLFRRDSAPLFGNSAANSSSPLALKNAQGQVIDPAEKSPTEGYYISQIDDSDISYFGFINKQGQWFIMRQDTDDSYRYTRGDKDAAGNWAQRSKLGYDYFDNVF